MKSFASWQALTQSRNVNKTSESSLIRRWKYVKQLSDNSISISQTGSICWLSCDVALVMLVAVDPSFPARKTELAMPWPGSWGWFWGKSRDPQPTTPCSLASEFVHPPNLQQWQSPFPNPFLCEDWVCGTWSLKPSFWNAQLRALQTKVER